MRADREFGGRQSHNGGPASPVALLRTSRLLTRCRLLTASPAPLLARPQVISQVRFSDLEVPTDAEVLLATLRGERRQRTAPSHHPSTYADDVAAIKACNGSRASPTPGSSYGEACGGFMPSTSPSGGKCPLLFLPYLTGCCALPRMLCGLPHKRCVTSADCLARLSACAVSDGLPPTPTGPAGGSGAGGSDKSWPQRISKLFTSCSSGGGSECGMDAAASGSDASAQGPQPGTPAAAVAPPVKLNFDELGEPDCLLVGSGWTIPVHRCASWAAWSAAAMVLTATPPCSKSHFALPCVICPA